MYTHDIVSAGLVLNTTLVRMVWAQGYLVPTVWTRDYQQSVSAARSRYCNAMWPSEPIGAYAASEQSALFCCCLPIDAGKSCAVRLARCVR